MQFVLCWPAGGRVKGEDVSLPLRIYFLIFSSYMQSGEWLHMLSMELRCVVQIFLGCKIEQNRHQRGRGIIRPIVPCPLSTSLYIKFNDYSKTDVISRKLSSTFRNVFIVRIVQYCQPMLMRRVDLNLEFELVRCGGERFNRT